SHTPDFTYLFDLNGRFTYINRALLSLWKKSFEEAVGMNFFDLEYPHELAGRLQRQIQQVIETKESLRDETPYTSPTGSTGFYEYIFVPVFGADGSVEAVAGSTREITKRKEAEAALQESEERFSAAFAHAPVAMVLTTPSGEFVEANKAYLDMLGYTRQEVAARSSDHFTHPDDIDATHAFGEAFRQGRTPPALEKRYIHKDGRVVWVHASGTMRRDEQGRPTQFIAILENITERKLFEEALKTSEERLQQVFTQAPVAICVLRGRELVFELVNPLFQALFPGRVVRGKALSDAIPELNAELLGILHNVLETGVAFAANEFKIPLDRDEDGVVEDYWFNFVYHPLRQLDQTVSAVVAVAVDVSAQVRARQALERANRELEEFAYVASHDLQEPLRMVNIYTQLLVRDLDAHLNDVSRGFAVQVTAGVRRMERLLKDLLNFSHVLLGESDQTSVLSADLNVSLARAIQTLQSRIEEEHAMVNSDPLPIVRGDEGQLTQVFQNLLSNALKYHRPNEPAEVHISSHADGDEWVVSVKDNGIGFEQDQAGRVFGLFKRLHKDEYPGTGLGLAICKRLIERYAGRVWAESIPGQGATFSFALPKVGER
ncbi:MAG TPA: PAS domain S-box protein, partial [Bryobacteraceae bacterium]|nr:PAS domain S-box protein [Bryobacteraceae bacterium]